MCRCCGGTYQQPHACLHQLGTSIAQSTNITLDVQARSIANLLLVFLIIMLAVTAQGTLGKAGLLGISQKKPTSDSCTAPATTPGA